MTQSVYELSFLFYYFIFIFIEQKLSVHKLMVHKNVRLALVSYHDMGSLPCSFTPRLVARLGCPSSSGQGQKNNVIVNKSVFSFHFFCLWSMQQLSVIIQIWKSFFLVLLGLCWEWLCRKVNVAHLRAVLQAAAAHVVCEDALNDEWEPSAKGPKKNYTVVGKYLDTSCSWHVLCMFKCN